MDMFASAQNAKYRLFCSKHREPGCWRVNALEHGEAMRNKSAWVFPPFNMIGAAVGTMRRFKISGVLVVPKLPTAIWWAAVQALPRVRQCDIRSDPGAVSYGPRAPKGSNKAYLKNYTAIAVQW